MANKFLELKDLKYELESQGILFPAVWEAFEKGKYPSNSEYDEFLNKISFHIEKFGKLLYRGQQGRGFACSIYKLNCIINVIAIKNAIYISIHKKGYERPIGAIIFYPCDGKLHNRKEMQYLEVRTQKENREAMLLLNIMRREMFERGVSIKEKKIMGGHLSFETPIKIIMTSILWRELINFNSIIKIYDILGFDFNEALLNEFYLEKKAELISKLIDGRPSTIAGGYGMYSLDPSVKKEANKSYMIIKATERDVFNLAEEYSLEFLENHPMKLIKDIAKETGLKPSVVGSYLKYSKNKKLSKLGSYMANKLLDEEHGISPMWRALIEDEPDINYVERVYIIAKEKKLSPISIITYAKSSDDELVRSEASILYNVFREIDFDITSQILDVQESNPSFSFEEIIKQISKNTGKNKMALLMYAKLSLNPQIKKNANLLVNRFYEKKYRITFTWNYIKANKPEVMPLDIAVEIAEIRKISIKRAVDLALCSKDSSVVYDGNIALSQMRKKGVFSIGFPNLFRAVVDVLNQRLKNDKYIIGTLKIRNLINLKLKSFSLANKIYRCLILLENLGQIELISKDYPKKFRLAEGNIDAEECLKALFNPINIRKVLKYEKIKSRKEMISIPEL